MRQKINTGDAEFARRLRAHFGLMAHISRLAGVTPATVSYVCNGFRVSARVMRIIERELARAEAGQFRRAA